MKKIDENENIFNYLYLKNTYSVSKTKTYNI